MLNFIARGKKLDIFSEALTGVKSTTKDWVTGERITPDGDETKCMIHVGKVNPDFILIDPETLCYKCPETDYWTNDVLKCTFDEGETYEQVDYVEVYFSQGAFLVDIEHGESSSLLVADLKDLGYKVERLGNTIDNPLLS